MKRLETFPFRPGVMDPNFIAAGAKEQVLKAVSSHFKLNFINL